MKAVVKVLAVVAVPAALAPAAALAEGPGHAVGRNVSEMKFVTFPGLPECGRNTVLSGDPAQGPSIILAKISSGCTVPWHWHSPTEELMMVSGTARLETRDAKPLVLTAAGYAKLPPRHLHQFRCVSECLMYVHADGPFDIHYVDSQGNEIAPEAALKRRQKTASAR